jgi:hypothetical protein
MKRLMTWMSLGLLLVAFVAVSAPAATAQTPVTLTVNNPTGALAVTQLFSARLSDLNGKTVCELTDGIWEDYRTFPVITTLLQKQFPTAKIVTTDKLPTATVNFDAKMVASVKTVGCQAVILGNAG